MAQRTALLVLLDGLDAAVSVDRIIRTDFTNASVTTQEIGGSFLDGKVHGMQRRQESEKGVSELAGHRPAYVPTEVVSSREVRQCP